LKVEMELSLQRRKQLQDRLSDVLKPELSQLSTEMQQILCDDLVTALENRLIVLVEAAKKPR
jgi:hypothetical protein